MDNKHKGTSFDSFLEEEDLLDDAEAVAVKRVISYGLQQIMKEKNLSKTEMAAKMDTSRSALERLLDPDNTSITLHTLVKAAHVLGKKLELSLNH